MSMHSVAVEKLKSLPPDLISTNRAPNDSELAFARAIMHDFKAELSEVRAKIAKVGAGLEELKSQRNALENGEAELSCILSPIRRIPQDIIGLIFEYCIDPVYYPTFSRGKAPILLTRISSSLRRIALNMHTLSTDVEFVIGPHPPSLSSLLDNGGGEDQSVYTLTSVKYGMEQWLRRSGSLPLKLSIYYNQFPEEAHDNIKEIYHKMTDIVISSHERWKDIKITFCGKLPRRTIFQLESLTTKSLPSLCKLKFDDRSAKIFSGINVVPILGSPSLKEICGICLDNLHIHKEFLRHSMSNLVQLHCSITNCSIFDIVTTLQQCTSLLDLCLWIYGINDDNSDQDFRIDLPYLEYFTDIELPGIDCTSMVSKYISAPQLKRFHLRREKEIQSSIADFFRRSRNITSLSIGAEISFNLFIQILRCCPQLTYLEGLPRFSNDGPANREAYNKLLIRLVDADDTGDALCPNIEHLDARCIPIIKIHTLYAFVMRKTAASKRLAPWKRLRARIECRMLDRLEVDDFLEKLDPAKFRLAVSRCYDAW